MTRTDEAILRASREATHPLRYCTVRCGLNPKRNAKQPPPPSAPSVACCLPIGCSAADSRGWGALTSLPRIYSRCNPWKGPWRANPVSKLNSKPSFKAWKVHSLKLISLQSFKRKCGTIGHTTIITSWDDVSKYGIRGGRIQQFHGPGPMD